MRFSFSHGGVAGRITRNLRPKTPTATLELSTGEHVEGADKVKERVLQILGVTEEIFNDIVLVAQDDLFGFLDRQPAKRKEAFQRLFGLQRAETIYADCTTAISQIEIPTITVDMDELRINVRQKEQQVRTLQEQFAQQPTEEAIRQGTADNQAVIDHVATSTRLRIEIGTQTPKLQQAEEAAAAATASLLQARQHETTILSAMRSNAEAADEANRIISNLTGWRRNNHLRRQAVQAVEAAESKLSSLIPPVRPAEYVVDRQSVQTRRNQLTNQIAQYDYAIQRGQQVVRPPHPGEKPACYVHDRAAWKAEVDPLVAIVDSYKRLLNSVAGEKACCDGCGTPVTSLQQKIAEAQENLPLCERRLQDLWTALRTTDDYDANLAHHEQNMEIVNEGLRAEEAKRPLANELHQIDFALTATADFDRYQFDYDTTLAATQNELVRARQLVAELPAEVDLTAYDAQKLQAVVDAQKTYAEGLAELRQELSLKEAEVGRQQGVVQTLKSQLSDLQTQLSAIPVYTQENRDHAQRNVEWWSAAKVRRETLAVQVQAAIDSHADFAKRLADNEAIIARSQRVREWKSYLEGVRGGFHKDAAPSVCALQQLRSLEEVVNEHLAMMQADFRVTPSDDLSFIARFNTGSVQPAARISGGQRVLLVFAVRLALSAMFAGTLGLLGLDEPTAYLDEHHIRGFEPAIEKLKEYSAATGLQCIIITHERSLAPLFDHVVNLAS